MATNSYSSTSTWTPTNALQPDRSTPPTLPVYSDTNPTQVAEFELRLPGSAAQTLGLPPGWTNITQVRIINTDLTNYLNLQFGATAASSVTVVLAPNGGEFNLTQAFAAGTPPTAIPLLASQVAFTTYGTWKAQGVTVAGSAASTTTSVYIWLAGI